MTTKETPTRLLIIGTTPSSAGVGGVTVHIERFLQHLDKEQYPYDMFDYKKEPFMKVFGKIKQSKAVHLHICNPYYMFILAVACVFYRKKFFLTLHGKYIQGVQKPWTLIKYAIKNSFVPIVLNKESLDACRRINPNTTIIPAFIPPQTDEKLESEITDLVKSLHAKGKLVAVTYGYDEVYDVNGNEIYGIDFLISFFNERNEYDLIISNPTGNYKKKYTACEENIHFIDYPHSLFELMKITDIFIRNTSKDGDSLSVKEALFLKKRVLCTDVVERPDGVQLFKYSDKKSFEACLKQNEPSNTPVVESGEFKIRELYRSL